MILDHKSYQETYVEVPRSIMGINDQNIQGGNTYKK